MAAPTTTTTTTTKASCLCGAITYEVAGAPGGRALCHCTNCRKASGSAFMANSFYPRDHFKFTCNIEDSPLRTYADSATEAGVTLTRAFCGNCGSPVYIENKVNEMMKEMIILPSGLMEKGEVAEEWKPDMEVFCLHRRQWMPELGYTKKLHTMK